MALQEPERSQMEDSVNAFHRVFQNIRLQNVAAVREDGDARVFQSFPQVVANPTKKVITDDYLCRVRFDQLVNYVASNKSRAADDQKAFAF